MSDERLDDVHGHVVVQMLGREDPAAVVGQEHERAVVRSARTRRDRDGAQAGTNRLDAERTGMLGTLQQIRGTWPRLTCVMVPMIAGRHGVRAIEALHVADDFSDHAAEAVADRDDARAIKLRWLDVEQVVDPTVRESAFEDIERCEFADLFDAEPALHEQLHERPVPKRRGFGGDRASITRRERQRGSFSRRSSINRIC